MAELNFNALIPEGPRGFYQGFEQGQDQKIARETNQIKLDELKRDRDEMLQLREQLKGLGQDPDPSKFLDTLARTGNPEYVKMAIEGKQKIKDLEAYAKLGVIEPLTAAPAMPAGAPASVVRMPQAAAPTNALGSGMFGMGAAPAAQAPVNALAPQPGAEQAARAQQRIDQLLTFARTNPRMAKQAMEEAKLLQDQLELFSRMKAPAPNRLADRFVPVGKNVFDREQQKWIAGPGGAIGGEGSKGAPAPKPMTALQEQKLRKEMVADKTHIGSAQTTADELEKLTDELVGNPDKNLPAHAGLGGITGWGALLPSAPNSDARKAEQKLETFKGKVKALGRQLASQEGKLGNMAVQEWKMVADAVQNIDPKAGNLDEQMRDVVRQARGFANSMKNKYDLTYEDEGAASAVSAAPAKPSKPGKPTAAPAVVNW